MTNSTAARVLEALGGNDYCVRIYENLRRKGDTKTMAGIRKFTKSYVGASNGAWAPELLKKLDASDREWRREQRRSKKKTERGSTLRP